MVFFLFGFAFDFDLACYLLFDFLTSRYWVVRPSSMIKSVWPLKTVWLRRERGCHQEAR
jgi:hypothetical protein